MTDPKLTVAEAMKTELWTLTPDTGVQSAYRLAADSGIRHLLVLDNGILAGVVSRRGLSRAGGALAVAPRRLEVRDVMAAPVLCVAPTTTVGEALQIMGENKVDFLPVIAGGFLVGYVDRQLLDGSPVPDIYADAVDLRAAAN